MTSSRAGRTIGQERNLAERIRWERESRGWSYEALAQQMTDKGCPINASSLYKIEKGSPRPRKISVDELVALSQVFDISVEDLLVPVEVMRNEQAKELVRELQTLKAEIMEKTATFYDDLRYYFVLAHVDEEAFDYVTHQVFGLKASRERHPSRWYALPAPQRTAFLMLEELRDLARSDWMAMHDE